MPRRPRDSVAFTVVVTVLVLLSALPVGTVLLLSGAPSTLLVATVLAALPVGPLVACYMWLDRYEPEPRVLLALGLVWGGVVATGFALVLGGVGQVVAPVPEVASLALIAPVTEELGKGLFVLLLLWWRRHELDGVLDGIVYAGMVGIGFAFVENILYLAAAYDGAAGAGGVGAVAGTFVVRCLFSPFAHPLFTAFTGIGIGIAVGARGGVLRFTAPVTGYVLAVAAHALWNFSTLFGLGGFAGTYFLLMVPAFFLVLGLAVWARRTEPRVLHAALHDAAARGLLPAVDIPWLIDLRARRASRRHALRVGGRPGLEALREYQRAAIELGFLHHRFLRGTPPPDFAERGQHFVSRIHAVRPRVRLPGQVVPT